jgi:hypothetical protein
MSSYTEVTAKFRQFVYLSEGVRVRACEVWDCEKENKQKENERVITCI